MSIAIPLRQRYADGWEVISWRFGISRPYLKRPAHVRHGKSMPAYTLRRWGKESGSRVRWDVYNWRMIQ